MEVTTDLQARLTTEAHDGASGGTEMEREDDQDVRCTISNIL